MDTAARPSIRAAEACRLLDLAAFAIIPALTASTIAYLHTGEVGYGVLLGAAMLVVLRAARSSSLPFELMPGARLATGALAPIAGGLLAVSVALAAGEHMALGTIAAPVAGVWLVASLGAWVKARFEDRRRASVPPSVCR